MLKKLFMGAVFVYHRHGKLLKTIMGSIIVVSIMAAVILANGASILFALMALVLLALLLSI